MNSRFGILFFCLVLPACVSVEMPRADIDEPQWITDRRRESLASSETPVSVPIERSDTAVIQENDARMGEVLDKREQLLRQTESLDGSGRISTEEFIETGRQRTTPPQ